MKDSLARVRFHLRRQNILRATFHVLSVVIGSAHRMDTVHHSASVSGTTKKYTENLSSSSSSSSSKPSNKSQQRKDRSSTSSSPSAIDELDQKHPDSAEDLDAELSKMDPPADLLDKLDAISSVFRTMGSKSFAWHEIDTDGRWKIFVHHPANDAAVQELLKTYGTDDLVRFVLKSDAHFQIRLQ